jgi:hypothetical protein
MLVNNCKSKWLQISDDSSRSPQLQISHEYTIEGFHRGRLVVLMFWGFCPASLFVQKPMLRDYLCVPSSVSLSSPHIRIYEVGRDGSVGIATRYGLDGPRIVSRWRRDFRHLTTPTLGPTQPPLQWVTDLLPKDKETRALTTHRHLVPRLKKEQRDL